jgi:hypothetical protein
VVAPILTYEAKFNSGPTVTKRSPGLIANKVGFVVFPKFIVAPDKTFITIGTVEPEFSMLIYGILSGCCPRELLGTMRISSAILNLSYINTLKSDIY